MSAFQRVAITATELDGVITITSYGTREDKVTRKQLDSKAAYNQAARNLHAGVRAAMATNGPVMVMRGDLQSVIKFD